MLLLYIKACWTDHLLNHKPSRYLEVAISQPFALMHPVPLLVGHIPTEDDGTVMRKVVLAKSGPGGPLLAAKSGPGGPVLAAKSGPSLPKLVLVGGHFWLPKLVPPDHFWLPKLVPQNQFWLPKMVQGDQFWLIKLVPQDHFRLIKPYQFGRRNWEGSLCKGLIEHVHVNLAEITIP